MANVKRFEDLEIWQLAIEIANIVYDITKADEFSRDFVLRDQARRAAVSIFSNIAEGFERDGNKEFINFLSISKGSSGELRAQLRFACNRNYIDEDKLNFLVSKFLNLSGQISNFTKYLKASEMRGRKFN